MGIKQDSEIIIALILLYRRVGNLFCGFEILNESQHAVLSHILELSPLKCIIF